MTLWNEEGYDGYVTLVNAKWENGQLTESQERTGHWAWKHYHKADDTTTHVELKGDMVLDGVDFGQNQDKIVLHDIKMYATPGQKDRFCRFYRGGKNYNYQSVESFYEYSGCNLL